MKERILLNWESTRYDYEKEADETPILNKPRKGLTWQFHKNFGRKENCKHIYLYNPRESMSDYRVENVVKFLQQEFIGHDIEPRLMTVDIMDMMKIQRKVEEIIKEHPQAEFIVEAGSGTTAMRFVWLALLQQYPDKIQIHLRKPGEHQGLETSEKYYQIKYDVKGYGIITSVLNNVKNNNLLTSDNEIMITSLNKETYDFAKEIAYYAYAQNVLIHGETGTGKESLAYEIHSQSGRNPKKFDAINCSLISESMMEAQIHGVVKGYATDVKEFAGIFERANGGTVFLDEIGNAPLVLQNALLRVLQNRTIKRLGSDEEIQLDLCIIVAHNENLHELAGKGKFKWDLYYRISDIILHLHPYRAHGKQDRWKMIQHHIKNEHRKFDKNFDTPFPKLRLDETLKNWLLEYSFPGNFRQIKKVIGFLYLKRGNIDRVATCYDLPPDLDDIAKLNVPNTEMRTFSWTETERRLIIRTLDKCQGNQNEAYQLIGYGSVNTLKSKIKKYNIQIKNFKFS